MAEKDIGKLCNALDFLIDLDLSSTENLRRCVQYHEVAVPYFADFMNNALAGEDCLDCFLDKDFEKDFTVIADYMRNNGYALKNFRFVKA